ncbi:hypothetical protein SAMN04488074_10137 [Lentzea albidocapillata subsp. violacea]|uniref:Uncharacterized protein n=1 Tax=Lentzea albidocapillata subsp. violacea TaxID=128104 RepID=A0A1G8PHH2_9PSEU|nr:hypothetical protein [Lentzea albidocapillata]SDI91964.1 hypothetical protein SAMN04488074_10137 [Lentzea albidocapillata subsp. violacea]
MSRLKKFARSLTEPRNGASADGRALGLGLSTALTEQRKDAEAQAAVARTLRKDAEGHSIHG